MARSNARLEVSGAGKTEDGLVQYNEEVNRLEDDLRELCETIRVNVDEEEQWKIMLHLWMKQTVMFTKRGGSNGGNKD